MSPTRYRTAPPRYGNHDPRRFVVPASLGRRRERVSGHRCLRALPVELPPSDVGRCNDLRLRPLPGNQLGGRDSNPQPRHPNWLTDDAAGSQPLPKLFCFQTSSGRDNRLPNVVTVVVLPRYRLRLTRDATSVDGRQHTVDDGKPEAKRGERDADREQQHDAGRSR